MIKVNVTAINNVSIQDPHPGSCDRVVWDIAAGETAGLMLQWEQMERLAPQLDRMAAAGALTFEVAPAGTYVREGVTYPLPAYAEQPEADTNPSIDSVGAIAIGGGSTSVVVNNLLGAQTFATLRLVSDEIATTWMDIVALNAGTSGNDISVEITNSGSAGLSVTYADSVVTIALSTAAGITIDAVTAAFNITMAGIAKAVATDGGTKKFIAAQAATALSGGLGTGFNVTLGGVACTVTDVAGSFGALTGLYTLTNAPMATLTVATPALEDAAVSSSAMLQVRSDNKVTNVSVPVTITPHAILACRVAAVDHDATAAGTAVPVYVSGLSTANCVLKTSASATANLVRVISMHTGAVANDITYKVTVALDDNLAVTWSPTTRTLHIALALTTASKNAVATVATAINASDANVNGFLFAKEFGTGNVATAYNPTAYTAMTPAYGGDYTFTVGGVAAVAAVATKIVPLAATGNIFLLTATTADMSAYATNTSMVPVNITANGIVSTVTVPTA